ncbi:MAG: PD40 domain-containing protein [Spirochaetales bacterium]|nr:PD40 domain-containing protein [Spirochaetales bacterium]
MRKNKPITLWLIYLLFIIPLTAEEAYPPIVPEGEMIEGIEKLVPGKHEDGELTVSRRSPFKAIAFSPDGTTIASVTASETINLWDYTTGRKSMIIGSHITSAAWSPDGTTIVSGSWDDTVKLWDCTTSKELMTIRGHASNVHSVAWSTDDKTLAFGLDDGTIKFWDRATGREIMTPLGNSDYVSSVAFSPDSTTLASGYFGDDVIRLWDRTTGREIMTLHGHSSAVHSVDFSPDGTILASGSADNTIKFWDRVTGREIKTLKGHSDDVNSIAFSPSGTTLASASTDNSIKFWDRATGKELMTLHGHSSSVYSLAFSPSGTTLASGSADETIKLWDCATGRELMTLQDHSSSVHSLAFSPDGTTFAFNSRKTVTLWNRTTNKKIRTLESHNAFIYFLVFLSDGITIASWPQDGTIKLWNSATGRESMTNKDYTFSISITSVAFSSDGKTIAFGLNDGAIKLWNRTTGKELMTKKGHGSAVISVALSTDGTMLASGLVDGTIKLWDITTGRELMTRKGHSNTVNSVVFSPDGTTIASRSIDKTVLWDCGTCSEIMTLQGHSYNVYSVAFSSDSTTFASGSYDGTIKLWDIATTRELITLKGHSKTVSSIAFSPDNTTIASSSWDDTIKLWDRVTYKLKSTLISGQNGNWLSYTPGGKVLRYDDGNFLCRMDGAKPVPVEPQDAEPGQLELMDNPQILNVTNGEVKNFSVTVKNASEHPVYWTYVVVDEKESEPTPLVFFPPSRVGVIQPGVEHTFSCGVSAYCTYESPEESSPILNLKIKGLNCSTITIPIQTKMEVPMLFLENLQLKKENKENFLSVRIMNRGSVPLSESTITLQVKDSDIQFTTVTQPEIGSGERVVVPFSVPEGLELTKDSRITVRVEKTAYPVHVWKFEDQNIEIITIFTYIFIIVGIIAGLGIIIFLFFLSPLPVILRISFKPDVVYTLPLDRFAGLCRFINNGGKNKKYLDAARFYRNPGPETWYPLIAELFSVAITPMGSGSFSCYEMSLGREFILNLPTCYIAFPPETEQLAGIRKRIRQLTRKPNPVVIIITINKEKIIEWQKAAASEGVFAVIPTLTDLTALLLHPDPLQVLTKIISMQIKPEYISPYTTAGGLRRQPMFFGRFQIISHILNREMTNYIIAGARKIGKSSLLFELERRCRELDTISCHFLELTGDDFSQRLAIITNLPPASSIDEIIDQIKKRKDPRTLVFLVDEADGFIQAEAEREYKTLKQFRKLSEEGICYFIFAGFWRLYETVAFDYHSPLKNFGEMLTLGELEEEACRDLCIKPMHMCNIHYETDKLVEQIISLTGGRPNLIALVCNEIIRELNITDRLIGQKDLDRAFHSSEIVDELTIHPLLEETETNSEETDHANRLDRIIIYACINHDRFSEDQVLDFLKEAGIQPDLQQIQNSLKRLELAFILGRKQEEYFFRVPLFVHYHRTRNIAKLLEWEIQRYSGE